MSARLLKLDERQRALTVVFNECREEDNLSSFLEELFRPGQCVYKKGSAPDVNGVLDILRREKDSGRAIIPNGNRIVFGWFMDLDDLTEAWSDNFTELASELMYDLEAGAPSDIHHVICFRHEVDHNKTTEKKREKASLLIRHARKVKKLTEENRFISQSIYLLKKNKLEDYDLQERAIARLLYLISRRGRTEVADFDINRGYCLGVVKGEDYFEEQKARLMEEIGKQKEWLNDPADPELERLKREIVQLIESKLNAVKEYGRNFDRKIPTFPVNIKDFSGSWFKGKESKIGKDHPVLKEYRDRYVSGKRRELIRGVGEDLPEIRRIVEDEYHFPDLELLRDCFQASAGESSPGNEPADSIYQSVMSMLRSGSQADKEMLVIPIYTAVKEELISVLKNTEDRKKAADRALALKNKELSKAGKYESIEECLHRIIDDSRQLFTHGEESFDTRVTALVGGRCESEWELRGYSVYGNETVYGCAAIAPYEVAVLSTDLLVRLDETSEGDEGAEESSPDGDGLSSTVGKLLDIIQ